MAVLWATGYLNHCCVLVSDVKALWLQSTNERGRVPAKNSTLIWGSEQPRPQLNTIRHCAQGRTQHRYTSPRFLNTKLFLVDSIFSFLYVLWCWDIQTYSPLISKELYPEYVGHKYTLQNAIIKKKSWAASLFTGLHEEWREIAGPDCSGEVSDVRFRMTIDSTSGG